MSLNPRVPFDAAVSGTGNVSVPDPVAGAYNEFDLILLIVQTANQPTTLSIPNGFIEETAYRYGSGTPGAAGAIGVQVFWKFAGKSVADGGTGNACEVADAGDHVVAQMYIFDWSGNQHTSSPFSTVSRAAYASGSTLHSPAHTTREAGEAIVAIFANAVSSAAEQLSGEANASLSGATNWSFGQTTSGVGGGFDVANGDKTTAGTFAADTWTGTMAGATPLVVVQLGIRTASTAPTQGLHPTLTVTADAFGETSGTVEMVYEIPQTPIEVAIGGFDEDMVLAGEDIRSLGWFDPDMIAEASSASDVVVDAEVAEATLEALAGTAGPGTATASAGVADATLEALGGAAEPGAAASSGAIAIATLQALGATGVAGAVTATAGIAEATLEGNAGGASSEATAGGGIAVATTSALAATAVPGTASTTAALAEITAAALGAAAIPGEAIATAGTAELSTEALDGSSSESSLGAIADATIAALPATAIAGDAAAAGAIAAITAEAIGPAAASAGEPEHPQRIAHHGPYPGTSFGLKPFPAQGRIVGAEPARAYLVALEARSSAEVDARAELADAALVALPAIARAGDVVAHAQDAIAIAIATPATLLPGEARSQAKLASLLPFSRTATAIAGSVGARAELAAAMVIARAGAAAGGVCAIADVAILVPIAIAATPRSSERAAG